MNGGIARDEWRITEIETGASLTGHEMKDRLHCSKEPIKA